MNAANHPTLERRLGFKEALALVIGSIIGTGVFLKTATMTQLVGGLGWVLTAWLVAGGMSFLGTLVYAELSSRFPQAGGEYVFLRQTYGSWVAFLYGWTRFWIASPSSIAAYAVGATTFLSSVVTLGGSTEKSILAAGMIGFFTLINCAQVTYGGLVQVILTWLKMGLVIGLTVLILFGTEHWALSETMAPVQTPTLQNFGLAVLSALWAFDGWNNMPMAAGEIASPRKTLPLALLLGVLICFVLYATANFSYFVALPVSEILNANSRAFPDAAPVAVKAALQIAGATAVPILSIGFVISALGAMNGSILTGARVPYAMARDGAFFSFLSKVGSHSHVPVTALLAQGLWACGLAFSHSFDQLTDYVVFSSWIFYGLCAASILPLRRKPLSNDTEAPYLCPGYPWVPLLFIMLSIALLANTIITMPQESMIGLTLIAAGIPCRMFFQRQHKI